MASEPIAVGGLCSHLVPPRGGDPEDPGLRPVASHSLLRLAIFRVMSEGHQFGGIANYRELLMPLVRRDAFLAMTGTIALPPGRSS